MPATTKEAIKRKQNNAYERHKQKLKDDPVYRKEYNRKRLEARRKNKPHKSLYFSAKSRAKKSGMEFTIEPTDIVIPTLCPVLGIPLVFGPGRDNSPSLDRIDNTKGYIKGNVWVISDRANRIKSDSTLQELQMLVTALTHLSVSAVPTHPPTVKCMVDHFSSARHFLSD